MSTNISILEFSDGLVVRTLSHWIAQVWSLVGELKSWDFLGGSVVKNLPLMQETQVQSLGWEDPLEKEMATHSSNFAWEIL